MVFSSLFFVYLFLPLNLLFYKLAPSIRARNIVMLVFSLIFYAWGEPVYLLLLLFMAFADWLIALFISKQAKASGKAKFGLFLMCIVNLGLLGVFKYGTFVLENVKFFTGFPEVVPEILLPIGISFYTFQLMSYVVDVYRGEVEAQRSFPMLLLYVSLFHQCIAGPIVRYQDVYKELLERKATSTDIADGIWRFCIGLAKKAVLANNCGLIVKTMLTENVGSDALSSIESGSVLALWVGMIAYMLQIYLDFSAYSDMAIGMGLMIGIHYRENFNYPYIASSVTEFWRRWHISLSSFFRDYVYIPLGGNRKGIIRTFINLFIVWFLTGLWHGASWNFVMWGLFFFVFLVLEKLFLLKILKKCKVISNIYLLVIVFAGWILFRFRDVNVIFATLKGLIGLNSNPLYDFESLTFLGSYSIILFISIIACTPLAKKCANFIRYHSMKNNAVAVIYGIFRILIPIALLLVSTATLVGDSYNPFMYFQF